MGSPGNSITTWHEETLPPETLRALTYLSKEEWLRNSPWYLAGGTALSLQVGHRRSLDLDFFTQENDFSIAGLLEHFSKDIWRVDIAREKTIFGELYGAKASFIAYPFFLPVLPYREYGAVQVVQEKDIAVMKIVAISQRGRKRDFLDLYWYTKNRESLLDVVLRLPRQFPTVAHDYHHIMKSLIYFDDAENDPMPTLFFDTDWETIKSHFHREVPKVAKTIMKME